jgi:hypothetical protein
LSNSVACGFPGTTVDSSAAYIVTPERVPDSLFATADLSGDVQRASVAVDVLAPKPLGVD